MRENFADLQQTKNEQNRSWKYFFCGCIKTKQEYVS